MKNINRPIIALLIFLNTASIFSQDDGNPPNQEELEIINQVGYGVNVRLYPVSMVFNGLNVSLQKGLEYNLEATFPQAPPSSGNQGWWWDYINGVGVWRTTNGGDNVFTYHGLENNQSISYNHDRGAASVHGCFGYGLWKVEISTSQYFDECDSVLFEQDYDDINTIGDNTIYYRLINGVPKIVFYLQEYGEIIVNYNNEDDYIIRAWKRFGRNKNYGNFKFSNNYNPYNIMPLDCRRDCNLTSVNQNHYFPYDWDYPLSSKNDVRQGDLTLRLTIDKNVSTPTVSQLVNGYKKFANQIKITPSSILTLDNGINFTMVEYPTIAQAVRMTVKGKPNPYESPGVLKLLSNSTFRIKKYSTLFLERDSRVTMSNGAKIIREPWGILCNQGAYITGGQIIMQGQTINCDIDNVELNFSDSTNITLEDSASWTIPDNSTIKLDGNVTCLKMSPNSEIKFGANSKLILQNGAHLVANNAKFTSLDPNTPWDGIYLSDISNDTITNCTIENAVNGINVTDKDYSMYNPPSTEISNCTFSNTTNTQLTSGVYVNNSTNVLVKGNNFTSSQLAQGFANGVMIEYCPAGSPVVVDNNIDKILTGIFVSQSSPYIARNTITGVTGSGKGIELDNSNGTVEYNIINNFVNSYTSSYSSPYLLKNTFYNASSVNVDLYVGSIPVIRPVNSGTLLRWLSGNNTISGSPSNAGISLVEESYPVMDSGFNKIMVGTSDYMSGAIPYSLSGELNAKMNYWYDNPPESQQMAVTGGTVLYDPTFDGSSLPPTDYTELNDIGFGLYDTVFVETLGGDTPSPENLFSQAYQFEKARQYLQAITLYKQIVANYRTSSYASVSLSRIFNCLEKKIGTNIDYQQLQTYMSQLRTNNLYPAGLREIAEDFIIKSKVKQGLLQSAINDYQTMYEQNQNNHKGIHALINKEILITMLNDTGDAPKGGTNIQKLANHKLKLLSIITGREFTPLMVTNTNQIPHEYKLYQNYPNPFNPKTTIKYDLPKDGYVSFKIYDILGKELLSLNEYKQAGTYTITLDGSNYASGLYFYKLESGSYVETKKMVLIK